MESELIGKNVDLGELVRLETTTAYNNCACNTHRLSSHMDAFRTKSAGCLHYFLPQVTAVAYELSQPNYDAQCVLTSPRSDCIHHRTVVTLTIMNETDENIKIAVLMKLRFYNGLA